MRKMTAIGLAALEAREARRLKAYRCSEGVLTIGVGHTSAAGAPTVTEGMTITDAECSAIFARDIVKYERPIDRALTNPHIDDHEFDALVSIAFNVGAESFARSTAIRHLNAGDRTAAAEAIMLWKKPASIITRRTAERDQFRTPYLVALPKARSDDKSPIRLRPGNEPTRPAETAGFFARVGALFGGNQ
jgi:lysozyme